MKKKNKRVLTNEEQINLIKQYRSGNLGARQQLIINNLGMVNKVALKFIGCNAEYDDLCSEGAIALIKAIDNYNIELGTLFDVYAYRCIHLSLFKYVLYNHNSIYVSYSKSFNAYKLEQSYWNLYQELGRKPSDNELAKYMHVSLKEVINLKRANIIIESLYEEIFVDNHNEYLVDEINDNTNYYDPDMLSMTVNNIMNDCLTQLERKIIELSFGFQGEEVLNCNKVGYKLSMESSKVRTIKEHALRKIRVKYGNYLK